MDTKLTMEEAKKEATTKTVLKWRQVAWILILLADIGLLAWAAMESCCPPRD